MIAYGIRRPSQYGGPPRPTTQTIKNRPYLDDRYVEIVGARWSTDGSGTDQTRYVADEDGESVSPGKVGGRAGGGSRV